MTGKPITADDQIIKTSGSDFHIEVQAGSADMIISDHIDGQFVLKDFLRREKAVIFNRDGVIYTDN